MLAPKTVSMWGEGQRFHCSITLRGKGQRLQNSAGQRTKENMPHRAIDPLFFDLVELLSIATCARQTHRDRVSGAKINQKDYLKLDYHILEKG